MVYYFGTVIAAYYFVWACGRTRSKLNLPHIILLIILFTMLMQGTVLAQSGSVFHIASFNIHYYVPSDDGDDWPERKY